MLTMQHIFGILATLAVFVTLGVYSGKKVKTSRDFSVSGNRSGSVLVAGTILGTLVGGASTIGTAQLAFVCGLSAWWFTLGGGLACLVLGLFLVKPFRSQANETIPGIIEEAFGRKAALSATLFITIGMIMNIVPQIMSSAALVSSLLPLSAKLAALFSVLLMIIYVYFGGVWGTGILGLLKIGLTSTSLVAAGILSLHKFGGASLLLDSFPRYPWFSLFGRGAANDLASGFSLFIGVLSSQIYFQTVVAAKSMSSARRGSLISVFVGPSIGLGGILAGLFMRAHHPDIRAVQALPLFILLYLPPVIAGIIIATLLFAAIGSGAGLALGACTILNRDIYQRLCPQADDKKVLYAFRSIILGSFGLALAVAYALGNNALILEWTYLSLGFRGAAAFLPMLCALFFAGKVDRQAGAWAVLAAPVSVIAWTILRPWPIDPLYPGLVISFVILLAGYLRARKSSYTLQAQQGR